MAAAHGATWQLHMVPHNHDSGQYVVHDMVVVHCAAKASNGGPPPVDGLGALQLMSFGYAQRWTRRCR